MVPLSKRWLSAPLLMALTLFGQEASPEGLLTSSDLESCLNEQCIMIQDEASSPAADRETVNASVPATKNETAKASCPHCKKTPVAQGSCSQTKQCAPKPRSACTCCKKKSKCPPAPRLQMDPGYNQTARITTMCDWDVFVDGSFIYWMPMEDGLEPGALVDTGGLSVNPDPLRTRTIQMKYQYKPGFKVGIGLGFDHDDWDAWAEYTRLHSTTQTKTTAQPEIALFSPYVVGVVSTAVAGPATFTEVVEKWTVNLDIVDVALSRWSYSGRCLVFDTYFGARGAWINQQITIKYSAPDGTIFPQASPAGLVQTISFKSTSWGAGPEIGLETQWRLGKGLRLYGSGSGDILFTRYNTRFKDSVNMIVNAGQISQISNTEKRINTVRTHLDLEMGFGWGSYLGCRTCYFDLSAGYGFQVFFNQNLFTTIPFQVDPLHNLYIHGMTAKARLDF